MTPLYSPTVMLLRTASEFSVLQKVHAFAVRVFNHPIRLLSLANVPYAQHGRFRSDSS